MKRWEATKTYGRLSREIQNLHLIPGDIRLSEFETDLAEFWAQCLQRKMRGFRGTTALSEMVNAVADNLGVDYVFFDSGPNIGPLNRAVLLDCDFFIVPVACDLFSLRALKTLGRTLVDWVSAWKTICDLAPRDIYLLPGRPVFLGYIPERFRVYGGRPSADQSAFLSRIDKEVYAQVVNIFAIRRFRSRTETDIEFQTWGNQGFWRKLNRREERQIEKLVAEYTANQELVRRFLIQLLNLLRESKELSDLVHSFRSRIKTESSLRDKLSRKFVEAKEAGTPIGITTDNLLTTVNDLAGIGCGSSSSTVQRGSRRSASGTARELLDPSKTGRGGRWGRLGDRRCYAVRIRPHSVGRGSVRTRALRGSPSRRRSRRWLATPAASGPPRRRPAASGRRSIPSGRGPSAGTPPRSPPWRWDSPAAR